MPIYEYACPRCRKIMSYLARSSAAAKTPSCPHCGLRELERRMSTFAVKTGRKGLEPGEKIGGEGGEPGGGGGEDFSPGEAQRFERLMEEMGRDIDKIDENDPRQIGRFLRKFGEAAGEDLGPEFKEAVGRLEAGEDPEKVEEQLSKTFGEEGGEEGGAFDSSSYTRDDSLYEM